MNKNNIHKKGSSETTREAFCFDLYERYKPQHIKTLDYAFLTFFIGFSEGEGSFLYWMDGTTQRAGFSIDQKDPQILFYIKKNLGFGTVTELKTKYWRFAIYDKTHLFRLYCLFLGNIVLNKRHLSFQKWSSLSSNILFPKDFSISNDYNGHVERNKILGANYISLENAWLAGFFQADGGFHVWANYVKFKIILRTYITQRGEVEVLKKIGFLFTEKPDPTISLITNGRTPFKYNRLEWASENALKQTFSYFKKFSLKGKKQLAYLRFRRIFDLRTKVKNGELIMSAKSFEKLKRIVKATKTYAKKP